MRKMKIQQKWMIAMVLVTFVGVGIFSFYIIKNLQGNARIVNYSGIVRGATQKLVKEEMYGKENDDLIERLDGILYDLQNGDGENQLEKMSDEQFSLLLEQVQRSWEELKKEILHVREGGGLESLFLQSEDYFNLADKLVSAAEIYSEKQARHARFWLMSLYFILIVLVAVTAIYGIRQKKMREELLQAEAASKEKGSFLARMSHEIRTPLNGIIGMTKIGIESLPDVEKSGQCLAKIDKASKFLLDLINDILDMSRIESGKTVLLNRAFHLSEMLDDLQELFADQAKEKQLDFLICQDNLDQGADLVMADELRTRQILINLLSNAMKFTPQKGKVRLDAESLNQGDGEPLIRFTVADTGIGMPEEFMSKMFEPFEQQNSSSLIYQGTGLGLAISFRLVELMEGTISVTSKINEGTVFTIDLPLKQAGEEDTKENSANVSNQAEMGLLKGAHILFAEDNELNAEIIEYLLQNADVHTSHAWDGEQAAAMFLEQEPGNFDLILMDVQMPKMNGLEAAEKIRKSGYGNGAEIPIIALTANAFSEDAKEAMERGMNGYLAKPIDNQELYHALAAQIKKHDGK
ncbi:MAG: ATP-binding protein [Clostridiales Family XIII bacterium]|nr:ATP-binding protein [Clostridia bacterium]MDE8734577.1 ATP-binding protein [Eubacteriales bacterium DFI.9.88]MDY3009754.1 ATP-binding protein [Clostridiales Family XIII bacterium]